MNTGVVSIVADTNVIVSMLGKTSPNRWIFDLILAGKVELCISNEILNEYQEVLSRQTSRLVADNFADFLVTFPYIRRVEVFFKWNLIQEDPDDNKFVDCAIAAQAYCIISEDRHFRPYRNLDYPPLKVFTVEEFKAVFESD
jgi:putative PIN family toxin of toxin-antitoxin system